MGKTYKAQPDEYFFNDFSQYAQGESELDDQIESLLLNTNARHRRRSQSHRLDINRHLLRRSPDVDGQWRQPMRHHGR